MEHSRLEYAQCVVQGQPFAHGKDGQCLQTDKWHSIYIKALSSKKAIQLNLKIQCS